MLKKIAIFKFYLVAKSLRRVAKNRELVIFTTVQVICSGKGVVFLLWGKPASVKAQTVLASYSKKDSKHAIIMSSHPSPLGATKTSSPFLGSKCF
jgi:uracil DNA glycosylase